MLQNFRFARYRFTYIVREPLKMPLYKGNIFRGRFGYLLRNITCIGDAGQCKKDCQFPEKCVYSKYFETPVPEDSPVLRRQTFAPHPFVIEPPRTGKRDYAPGDTLACELVLIGDALEVLPWIVFTLHKMGEQRMGLKNERGRCHLDRIESLPARDSYPSRTIYTEETQTLTDEGLILGIDDVMADAPHVTDTIQLAFLTPTSIKLKGQWMRDLTFEHLIRNLLRRIRFLSLCHCAEELDVDAHALIEAAGSVEHKFYLKWLRRDRYSHRTEASIPMDGFIGSIRYEEDLRQFLPFILLGEHLHIGHHTAFGYGQYRLMVNPENR